MAFSWKKYQELYKGLEKHPEKKGVYLFRGYYIELHKRNPVSGFSEDRWYIKNVVRRILPASLDRGWGYSLKGALDFIETHLPACCRQCGKRLYHTNPELVDGHGCCFDCWSEWDGKCPTEITHTKE